MTQLRLAARSLLKTPLVTLVAVASLALGTGANAAIFSVFEQVLLRPLPVTQPEQLVNLSSPGPRSGSMSSNQAGGSDAIFSYPMFRDLQREQTPFDGIAAHRSFGANLGLGGSTYRGSGMLVSGKYFPLLGLQPALGRLFDDSDDQTPGAHPLVVLTHSHWTNRFEQDPLVLGQPLLVNGQPMTIVGVTPPDFLGTTLGADPLIFVPISMRAQTSPGWKGFDDRKNYWAYLFARLSPGMSLEQAQTAINVP